MMAIEFWEEKVMIQNHIVLRSSRPGAVVNESD